MCYNVVMELKLQQTLIDLAKIFEQNGSKLFVVGGFVRNAILGFCETDTDICGPMRFDLVQKMLKNTPFSTKLVNKNLGTLHIKSKITNEEFEYTTFRTESYTQGGIHTPEKIVFVDDIKKDVKRRDFSCNAIYYDISENKLVDLCSGLLDTKMHILRTVDVPTKTFDDDGLRILRLIRMCCELDFDIEQDTMAAAIEKIDNLKDISQQRFNKEIVAILFSDYKYQAIKNPHCPTKGIKILCEIGAFGYIFREISFHMGKDALNSKLTKPWLHNFAAAPVLHRISVFCYEILKALDLEITKKNINAILGENGLVLSKKEVSLQAKLLCGLEELKALELGQESLFIQKYFDVITRLLDFARIFGLGQNVRTRLNIMKADGVPMEIKDLKINGQDLIKNFPNIAKTNYSKVLNELLSDCLILPELNTKQNLIRHLKGKQK